MKHLIKHEYPNLKSLDYKKVLAYIDGKCSEYYFLDYMRCSNGDVDDAIKFYELDIDLRSILLKYIILFEIQLKTDFASLFYEKTHSSFFWKKKKFYIPDAIKRNIKGKPSKYFLMKKKIESGIKRLHFSTIGPSYLVAMYTCSFGTFQELFKITKREYKENFIVKYCKNLNESGYKILNTYFEAIRKIRNRCAHGNHIISTKILHELRNLKFGIREENNKNDGIVMTKTLTFIFNELHCGKEFKEVLLNYLHLSKDLLLKYSKTHSMPKILLNNLDKN